jgi:hypothetical protein
MPATFTQHIVFCCVNTARCTEKCIQASSNVDLKCVVENEPYNRSVDVEFIIKIHERTVLIYLWFI